MKSLFIRLVSRRITWIGLQCHRPELFHPKMETSIANDAPKTSWVKPEVPNSRLMIEPTQERHVNCNNSAVRRSKNVTVQHSLSNTHQCHLPSRRARETKPRSRSTSRCQTNSSGRFVQFVCQQTGWKSPRQTAQGKSRNSSLKFAPQQVAGRKCARCSTNAVTSHLYSRASALVPFKISLGGAY